VDGAPTSTGLNGSVKGDQSSTSAIATHSQTTITPTPEPQPQSQPAEPLPRKIEEFDELIENDVTAFVQAAGQVGGLVEEQVRPTKWLAEQY